jgi:hypothetical protein
VSRTSSAKPAEVVQEVRGAGWRHPSGGRLLPTRKSRRRPPVIEALPDATTRVRLRFGLMILPLRPTVWVAKQVASLLTDVNGPYVMPAEQVSTIVMTGGPAAIAARLSEHAEVGVQRVVVTLPAGDWRRQAELLADAHTLLG